MKYLTAIIICVLVAGIIALTVRLSTETLGILAAAALGIAGGACGAIPVSVVLVWALIRRTANSQNQPPGQQPYPPVIVIGGNGQPLGLPHEPSPFHSLPAPRRDFRVVPEDDGDIL
jgi:uncharacterized membrane protein YeaQ/YmgE (transglycosylase-associated protein family)